MALVEKEKVKEKINFKKMENNNATGCMEFLSVRERRQSKTEKKRYLHSC